jgi:uncharacterized protein YecT (DUF1311 family)
MDKLQRSLAQLFEVRHILVHEFPKRKPCSSAEIASFFDSAIVFLQAVDEVLAIRLYGPPLNQAQMNRAARERSEEKNQELDKLCHEVAQKTDSKTILSVQALWRQFSEAEASRQSEECEGGTMRPFVYHHALATITERRIEELRKLMPEKE